jgi:hypothetical protein
VRKQTSVLAILLTAVSGGALWLAIELSVERERNASLLARLDSAHEAMARANGASQSKVSVASEAPPVPRALPASLTDAPRAVENPAAVAAREWPREQQRLLQNPDYQLAARAQQRAGIEFTFRDLPKALNLSPEKANLVFDLLTDQAMHRMQGDREEDRLVDDARFTDVLGFEGAKRLEEFRAAIPSRAEANSLRSSLASAGQPLRDDQFDPLVAIVRAEQERFDKEVHEHLERDQPQAYDVKSAELRLAANQRILEASQTLLTSAQYSTLEAHYRNQRQLSEAMSRMMSLQIEQSIRDAQAGRSN